MWNERTMLGHVSLCSLVQREKDPESRKAILYSIASNLATGDFDIPEEVRDWAWKYCSQVESENDTETPDAPPA